MENEPEMIRQEMQEKRNELTEKLETLEDRVMKTASAISDTVKNVEEGVEGTAESIKESFQGVKDTIKDALNLYKQVDRHPLAMVGGSVGVGFLFGRFLRRRRQRTEWDTGSEPEWPEQEPMRFASTRARQEIAPGTSSVVLGAVKHGLSRLKDIALGYVFDAVGQTIEQGMPTSLGSQLRSIVNEIATQVRGGEGSEAGSSQAGYAAANPGASYQETRHEPNGRRPWEASTP